MGLWDFTIIYAGLAVVGFYAAVLAWRFVGKPVTRPFCKVAEETLVNAIQQRFVREGMDEDKARLRARDVVRLGRDFGPESY